MTPCGGAATHTRRRHRHPQAPASKATLALRRRSEALLRDPAAARLFEEGKSPALKWTAAAVAALRGHADCAAACLTRPARRAAPRLDGDGVGVLTAGVLGGADVVALGEALASAAKVPRSALATAADSGDQGFGGCRPLLLAASLGRPDAVGALCRLGADPDAFVPVAPRPSGLIFAPRWPWRCAVLQEDTTTRSVTTLCEKVISKTVVRLELSVAGPRRRETTRSRPRRRAPTPRAR